MGLKGDRFAEVFADEWRLRDLVMKITIELDRRETHAQPMRGGEAFIAVIGEQVVQVLLRRDAKTEHQEQKTRKRAACGAS